MESRVLLLLLFFLCFIFTIPRTNSYDSSKNGDDTSRVTITANDGPESVVWIVQLSDLHFSVHHPERALDFRSFVGPALSFINPSLVLITGDLTDGKSKDMLTMKQDEKEWVEYQNVMEDVIKRSGLDKHNFYDLRGNHDNFGVPNVGGSFDFFSNYSINGQLKRIGNVNSVTVENKERKHLFVGIDSTMPFGLRGPTNLFGHPTDQLLTKIDLELSQHNSQSAKPLTKISFGHFPISFSASTNSGKSLKDIFLKHSLSAYLCGHLHSRFGKNLKRHHHISQHLSSFQAFQMNLHQIPSESTKNCSDDNTPINHEFWEWEMGDWRKSRAMRILAIDKGHVSFIDVDFKSGAKKTIVMPTFPLDSRLMLSFSLLDSFKCRNIDPTSFNLLRALVFSVSPIVSVTARIYDSSPGNLHLVMESPMNKHENISSRGDIYTVPWNIKAFEDPSPDRYLLQIEAVDIMGRSTSNDMMPFSINNISAKLSWTWTEFFVMGIQWESLYYPVFWYVILVLLYILLIPKAVLVFSKKQYTYKYFSSSKSLLNGIAWVLTDLCRDSVIWFGLLGYLLYLILFPWIFGIVSTAGEERGYMTYRGWVVNNFNNKEIEFIGFPDIMVVVLSHLFCVVSPAVLFIAALTAEQGVYRVHFLTLSGKKEDDYERNHKRSRKRSRLICGERWFRNVMLLACLVICWEHFKKCRALMKAYEMNPVLHFPFYSFTVPLLIAYAIYKTRRV